MGGSDTHILSLEYAPDFYIKQQMSNNSRNWKSKGIIHLSWMLKLSVLDIRSVDKTKFVSYPHLVYIYVFKKKKKSNSLQNDTIWIEHPKIWYRLPAQGSITTWMFNELPIFSLFLSNLFHFSENNHNILKEHE